MVISRLRQMVIAFLMVVLAASVLKAQSSSTGALTGTVRDATGAVVPNARVTCVNASTRQERSVKTGADGIYNIGLLPPGTYSVKFEAPGFQAAVAPSITVTVTETGTLSQTLTVGAQSQQVTVEADAVAVQTTNATIGATISGRTVTDLPLATRNYSNLLSSSAGANATVVNAAGLGKNTQPTNVGGANSQQNNYQMDGASIVSYTGIGGVTEGGSRGAFGIPNPDTIQEVKIQTSQYDAGYGRNPGANVNVVTKSGTNDFHGTAFEYFRNTVLNAGDFFAKANGLTGNATRLLDQNQYGGVFGGPIRKDKLFFFVSYQGTDQKNGTSGFGLINTFLPALPAGSRGTCPTGATAISQCDTNAQVFAASLGAMYAGAQGAIFPGMAVASDGSNINPTALQIFQIKLPNGAYYIPTPPTSGGVASPGVTCKPVGDLPGFNNPSVPGAPYNWVGEASCTSVSPAIYHERQGMGNWDYVISDKHTLSGRYFYSTAPSIQPFYQQGVNLPGTPENATFTNHEAILKLTSVLTANFVNEARASYQRNLIDTSTFSSFLTASNVGMTALNAGIGYDVLPRIDIGPMNFGTSVFGTTTNHADQFQWADQLSWTHGKHSLRAGVEIGHTNWNWNFSKGLGAGLAIILSPANFLLGRSGCTPGTFPVTCNPGIPGSTNGTFFSDIFVEPTFATRFAPSGGDYHFWNWTYSAFLQDDFKVTSHLTLNLGIRWEYDGYPSERDGLGTNINTVLAASASVPQTSGPCPISPPNPAPPAPCPGSTLAGFTVPSNYNTSKLGPIPTGVIQRSGTVMGEQATPRSDFAPRIGFAWEPLANGRFVVRGGAGFFYDMIGGELYIHGVLQSVPYAETIGGAATGISFASLQDPWGDTPANWIPRWVTASGESSNINQPFLPTSFPVPLTYQWNLSTQFRLFNTWVAEIGYVGSHGIHQNTDTFPGNPALMQNAAITGDSPSVSNVNLRTPLLGFSPQLTGFANNTDYKYNALQATLTKQLSHGLTFQAGYSYNRAFQSRWQGNSLIRGTNPNPTWSLNPIVSEYGLSSDYHPNRFTLNYSYELPIKDKHGVFGVLVTGWRVSGQTTIQDGTPISIQDGGFGTIFGSPVTSQAQLQTGASKADIPSTGGTESRLNSWINASAFCTSASKPPCALTAVGDGSGFGNAGLGSILGPPQDNWDISLSKVTRVGGIREGATLEFRTEFFNAFNHPQFGNPNPSSAAVPGSGTSIDVSTANSSAITNLSVNPRLIQFGLKYSF